jgi:HEPN domain-containing protein
LPKPSTQEWLDKAREDEEVVTLIIVNGGPWSMAAYHIQQAIEKYLKALLVERDFAPPKIHGLGQLLDLIPGGPAPRDVEEATIMTTSFGWMTRYPGSPPLDEPQVQSATKSLRDVKDWVLTELLAPYSEQTLTEKAHKQNQDPKEKG